MRLFTMSHNLVEYVYGFKYFVTKERFVNRAAEPGMLTNNYVKG